MGSPCFAEFFAGVGLVRLGLEQVGWKCVFANDNDPKKAAMYKKNFMEDHLYESDIEKLKPSDVPEIELATASFPCTDLSLAGMRRGLSGGQSGSFYSFIRLMRKMGGARPGLILLENVPGLLTSHDGADIGRALTALNDIGYRVDMFIADARWFVPQSRKRLFIIGVRSSGKSAGIRFFERRDSRLKPGSLTRVVERAANIRWSFNDIPAPPENHEITLEDILEPDGNVKWWDKSEVTRLVSQMNLAHAKVVDTLMLGDDRSYRTVYRRVRDGVVRAEIRKDRVAGCLRPPRGGSSKQILLAAGKGNVMARGLTARECARLQGVDDEYKIPGSQNDGLFGFGDAVCVPVIRWIANKALGPLYAERRKRKP